MDEKQLQKYWLVYTDAWCLIKNRDRVRETHVAEMVKKQFILKGNEIYQMLITKLTEEEK